MTAPEITVTPGLNGLLRRAAAGDRATLAELRRALDEQPALWRHLGDLAVVARNAWLERLGGTHLVFRKAVERQLAELRTELPGPGPSPLERLPVDRILGCWLQCYGADADAADAKLKGAAAQEAMRRQESAQRRYLASIKQLALVRKLLRPGVPTLGIVSAEADEPKKRARPSRLAATAG